LTAIKNRQFGLLGELSNGFEIASQIPKLLPATTAYPFLAEPLAFGE
jgi:hypothetical protein